MRFEPISYADRLTIVNPQGDVGIATLWSPRRATVRVLERLSPTLLDAENSRIAVIANLYGDGLHHMLANLLHNPQVRHVVALGEQMGLPTVAELSAFLADGVEPATVLGAEVLRIVGTDRVLPVLPGFDAERVRSQIDFSYAGPLGSLSAAFVTTLDSLPVLPRADGGRVYVDLSAPGVPGRPSAVTSHQVSRSHVLDAWRELVVRTVRFGVDADVGGREGVGRGVRRELLNARAVITDPDADVPDALAAYGFVPDDVRAYQERMLSAREPDGVAYTYGHRLRGHGGHDALAAVIARLRDVPGSRRAYVSLWDTGHDLPGEHSAPCLVALAFRISGDRLTLTATFRAHNLLTAWVPNVYGLLAVQRHVATALDVAAGSVTVISHQLGIDPDSPRLPVATAIEAAWTRDEDAGSTLREDPHGYFVVSASDGEIVAEHRSGSLLIKEYRGRRASVIAGQVAADMAVGLVSHALWLGGELARAEAQLAPDRPSRR